MDDAKLDAIINQFFGPDGVPFDALDANLQKAEDYARSHKLQAGFAADHIGARLMAAHNQVNHSATPYLSVIFLAMNEAGMMPDHSNPNDPANDAAVRALFTYIDTDHNEIITPDELRHLAKGDPALNAQIKADPAIQKAGWYR